MYFISTVYFVSSLILTSVAVVRKWKPNNSFESAENWVSGKPPCYGDEVQIADQQTTHTTQHHFLSGLKLPSQGEIIFAEGSVLDIVDLARVPLQQQEDTNKEYCRRETSACYCLENGRTKKAAVFNADSTSNSWFDPRNWKLPDDEGLDYTILDSERIPCNGDEVEFPGGVSFQIEMPTTLKKPIQLKSFKIGPLALNQQIMGQYLANSLFFASENKNGSLKGYLTTNFSDGDSNSYSSLQANFMKIGDDEIVNVCDPAAGCKCGNDRLEIMEKLCPFALNITKPPSNIKCDDPIKVMGKCSRVCGAVLRIRPNQLHPVFLKVRRMINELSREYSENLNIHTAILDDNAIQVLFLYSTTFIPPSGIRADDVNHAAKTAAEYVKLRLDGDTKGQYPLIDDILMTASYSPQYVDPNSQGHALEHSGASAGTISGIVIAVLLLIVFVLLGLLMWRRRRGLPFTFRHLDTDADRDVVEMEGTNFQNPLFNPGANSLSRLTKRNRRGDQMQLLEEDAENDSPDDDYDRLDTGPEYFEALPENIGSRRTAENHF